MADKKTEQLFGGFGVLLAVAQHDVVAELTRVRFDAEGNLGVERVCDLGDDKSDDICAAADEAAGQRVDTVALLVADFYDPLARRFTQLLGAAEGAGYGRSGDAGDAGDVLDCYMAHMACCFLP